MNDIFVINKILFSLVAFLLFLSFKDHCGISINKLTIIVDIFVGRILSVTAFIIF
jgi:hypothetical protein